MKKLSFLTVVLALIMGITLTQSCKKTSPASPTAGPTLYDSLGGTTLVADPANPGTMIQQGRLNIRSVVDSAIFVIAADAQINSYFSVLLAEVTAGNTSGYVALTNNLTDFLCVGSGATAYTYGGRSMSDAHNPATNSRINAVVTTAAFSEFINDVVKGAQKNGLTTTQINSVGRVLNSLESSVVNQSGT